MAQDDWPYVHNWQQGIYDDWEENGYGPDPSEAVARLYSDFKNACDVVPKEYIPGEYQAIC